MVLEFVAFLKKVGFNIHIVQVQGIVCGISEYIIDIKRRATDLAATSLFQ